VTEVELVLFLVASHGNLVGVDDNNVITNIHVGSKHRFVLATQNECNLGGQPAESRTIGVDDEPGTLNVARLWRVCLLKLWFHGSTLEVKHGRKKIPRDAEAEPNCKRDGPLAPIRTHRCRTSVSLRAMIEPLELEEIVAARERGASVVLTTPVLPSTSFARIAGREVILKAENLQRTGSFKIRGAMNALATLSADQTKLGVVAASAGNHAQGVALAAQTLDIPATVFMPLGAAIPKINATESYGATVVLAGANLGEAVDHARAFEKDHGALFIHPYDNRAIIAGQGSLGLEVLEQVPEMATLVAPIGGGGLIGGLSTAVKALRPDVTIVGVQSEAVPTYVESRRLGRPTAVEPKPTVADGIACHLPSDLAFDCIERWVDDIVTVDDVAATKAVTLLLERAKYLVEPSGAVVVAALLEGKVPESDGPVVLILSGGNIDLLLVDQLVRHGQEARGRFASVTAWVPDTPGQLARMLETIGRAGANILSVEHHREGSGLPLGMVQIQLTFATRSWTHVNEIVDALEDVGVTIRTRPTR
jgi:threonine dehydratase